MFSIDYKSRTPIYQQIISNVEKLAARNILQPDSQLPSVRALAVELSINPNTIAKAYNELEAKGIIYSLPGRGSFISDNAQYLRQQGIKDISLRIRAAADDGHKLDMTEEEFIAMAKEAWSNGKGKEGEEF